MRRIKGHAGWAALTALTVGWIALGPSAARAQDHIVVVLDASGSMSERMGGQSITRMEAAKQALVEVMRNIPDNTIVGLLVFSGRGVGRDHWVYPLSPIDKAEMEQAIARPRPRGGTPLGRYLKIGADALLEKREANHGYGTYRLLVVSDGRATDPHLVKRYLPEVTSRGVIVDAIGVDMKEDHELARDVNSYRRANDTTSLKKAVADVFAEIGVQQGQDASGKESFALIAALPDGMAEQLLKSLTAKRNDPIGTVAARPERLPRRNASARPGQPAAPRPSRPVSPPPAPSRSNRGFSSWKLVIAGIIALTIISRSGSKKKRRRWQ